MEKTGGKVKKLTRIGKMGREMRGNLEKLAALGADVRIYSDAKNKERITGTCIMQEGEKKNTILATGGASTGRNWIGYADVQI